MVRVIHNKSLYLLFLAGLFLPASNTFADGNTTDFSITVNPSLSLSVSSANVGFELTPTQAGSYDSASFNVYSSTNNATGYTLTMSTNNVNLTSNTVNPNTGTNPTIPTLAETQDGITSAQFQSSTDSNVLNHYGISIAGANYNAMKASSQVKKTAENNTSQDTTAIALASKLDLLTVPGVYSTTLNFALVANPLPPVIPFIDPDPDPTNPTAHPCVKMGDLECEDTDNDGVPDSLVFPANSLLRTYEIAYTNADKPMYVEDSNADIGWRPMTAADEATIGGKEVRFAIQDISMTLDDTANSNNVCEAAAATTINSTTYEPIYVDEALVMDIRDGKSYWIAKLADGKCWMTQNLDLDLIHTDGDANAKYTHANTDLGWGTDATTTTWNPTRSTIPSSAISASGAISGWVDSSTSPYSVDTGEWYWTDTWYAIDYCGDYQYDYDGCNYLSRSNDKFSQSPTGSGLHGHVGNYYNWTAAIASNDSSNYGASSTFDNISQNPQNSICPAGWRLPIVTNYTDGQFGDNDFYNLNLGHGNVANTDRVLAANPIWFVRGGDIGFVNELHGSGIDGSYWSSTVGTNSGIAIGVYSVGFGFDTNYEEEFAWFTDYFGGYFATTVRCIAR